MGKWWCKCEWSSHTYPASADREPRQDRMAANAGNSERRFIDLHADLVQNVQLKVFDYAKLLISGGMTPDPGYPAQNRQALIDLDTEDGYPLMPDVGEMTSMKKEDLRNLLRRYLTEQYSE
jgi:hypothetical protein